MYQKSVYPLSQALLPLLPATGVLRRNETPLLYPSDRLDEYAKTRSSCSLCMSSWPNTVFVPEPVDPLFDTKWEERPKRKTPPFLVHNLIRGGWLTILYSPSGLGKSRLMLELLNAVANGLPFKDRRTKARKTLYLDYEMGEADLQRYGDELGVSGYIIPQHDVPLEAISDLLRRAKRGGCEVIVIDSYASIANQTGEDNAVNSNAVAEKVLKPLADLAHNLGLAIIVLHHTKKDGTQFEGAQRIKGLADAMLKLSLDRTTGEMSLSADKVRGQFEPLSWDAKEHPNLQGRARAGGEAKARNQDDERREWLFHLLAQGPLLSSEVNTRFQAHFGKNPKRLEHIIRAAVDEGSIKRTQVGRQAELSRTQIVLQA